MVTVWHDSDQVSIPSGITDLASFRRWAESDEFPESGRIWFLNGEVWVDMSKEQLFSHVMVKNEFAFALTGLNKATKLGIFWADGLFLSNAEAGIGGNPDGTFVSHETMEAGRAWLVEGVDEGYVELEGSPDMVLEVVSRSSVHKDCVLLKHAYWEAGVKEYWVVDARQEPAQFDIYRRTVRGFATVRKEDGWTKSAVFGKSFRLAQRRDAQGHPEFTLEVR